MSSFRKYIKVDIVQSIWLQLSYPSLVKGQGFKIDTPMFIKLARKVGVTSWCVYSWFGNLTLPNLCSACDFKGTHFKDRTHWGNHLGVCASTQVDLIWQDAQNGKKVWWECKSSYFLQHMVLIQWKPIVSCMHKSVPKQGRRNRWVWGAVAPPIFLEKSPAGLAKESYRGQKFWNDTGRGKMKTDF